VVKKEINLCLKEQKEILNEKTGKIHPKNKISQKIEFIFSFQIKNIECPK